MSADARITVVAATTIRVNQHAEAIRRTLRVLPVPARGLLICPTQTPALACDRNIKWKQLPADWAPGGHWTITDFSRFMLQGLVDCIDTEFCITVHWDGFALNKRNWTDEFFEYDYIGAPWPATMNEARVGNGGFSLRSARWLAFVAALLGWHGENEDDWACRLRRRDLELSGMKIAPLSVAAKFSIEHPIEEFPNRTVSDCLGFHGEFTPGTKGLSLK